MSHSLTLQFATISELQAAVNLLAGVKAAPGNDKPATTSSTKPAASAAAGDKPKAADKPKAEDKPKTETPAEPFPYADLQKAVMALVKVDPTGPKAVLEHFNIPTFKGSDPAIWAEAKAMLEAAAAAAEAA